MNRRHVLVLAAGALSGLPVLALLMDSAGSMGRAYGAVVTPHMFVVGPKGDLVYVRAALEDLAAGRKIATPSTRPFGCTIAYSSD